MLSEAAVKEVISSKDMLTEYATATWVQAVNLALQRLRDPDVNPNAFAGFIETLRKTRADLTGDNGSSAMPTMMVNIQFDKHQAPILVGSQTTADPLTGTPPILVGSQTTADPLTGSPPSFLATSSNILDAEYESA